MGKSSTRDPCKCNLFCLEDVVRTGRYCLLEEEKERRKAQKKDNKDG